MCGPRPDLPRRLSYRTDRTNIRGDRSPEAKRAERAVQSRYSPQDVRASERVHEYGCMRTCAGVCVRVYMCMCVCV